MQWVGRIGVRRLTSATLTECAHSDHWPPELRPPSRALPSAYAQQLGGTGDAVLPTLPPTPQPNQAAVCYASPTHFCVHLLTERGRLRYSVDDGTGSVVGRALALTRLVRYTFQMVGVHAAHPLVVSDSDTGPDRRRVLEVVGAHPAWGYDLFAITPQAATPDTLYYQSATRSGLGGPIYISNTREVRRVARSNAVGARGVRWPQPRRAELVDGWVGRRSHARCRARAACPSTRRAR